MRSIRSIAFDDTTAALARDRRALVLSIAFTTAILYGAMISPALPGIVSDVDGATSANIGLVLTVQTAVVVCFLPIVGVLAGRVGPQRILVPSLFCYGLFGVLTAFADSFTQVLLLRAIQGIAYTGIIPMVTTLVSQSYSGDEEIGAQGLLSVTTGIAGVVYPVVGGALAGLAWQAPFLFYGVLIPVAALAYFSLDDPGKTSSQSPSAYLTGVLTNVRSPIHLASFSWGFTIFFHRLVIITYVPLLAVQRFDASAFTIGLLIASIGVLKTLSSAQINRVHRHAPVPRHVVVVLGVLLASVSVIALSFVTSLVAAFVVLSAFGISYGISLPLNRTLITITTPAPFRSATFASLSMMNNLGKTIAPVAVGGLLALGIHLESVFLVVGTALVLTTATIATYAYVLRAGVLEG